MASSTAKTVEGYLDELPEERRTVVAGIRKVIRKHLPKGYAEMMGFGMITYCIPLSRYPKTYNGQPLCYTSLAAQKNGYSLYLMQVYQDPELEQRLRDAFAEAGKRLDMGKSCLRFKRMEDLPLDAIGAIIGAVPPERFIDRYEATRRK